MEFLILGPLEVRNEQGAVTLRGSKPRALLAVLLLHANEPVSAERLAVALWGNEAPAAAVNRVHVHVSRLRKALGDVEVLTTTPAGYRLRVRPGELDAERFERLVEDGRGALAAGEPERAAALVRQALALWRGPPLADLAFEAFVQAELGRLEDQRLAALEARIDADLATGRHAALVGELQRLVADHPTRERLAGQLMLALYRCGRQVDALEAYRQARRVLVANVGVEPGPELRRLHEAILRQDAWLDLQPAVAELPRALAHDAELDVVARPSEPNAVELPTGVVTFLLTDIEGSTRLWERDPEGMARTLELHDQLIARAVEGNGGCLLKSKGEGDSTLSVFRRASHAVACAVDLRSALAATSSPAGLELRVRVALHTGEAHERDGEYYGPALNRAARLRALARGGATVVSHATTEIVRDRLPDEVELVDVGERRLPGLSRPERVFELRARAGAPPQGTPPLRRPIRLALPRALGVATDLPFVGRDRELGRVHELWARAADGARAVIVAGEPGIGKTRLAAEFAGAMYATGGLVLYGRCDERVAVPYQPFVEALGPAARAIGIDRLRAELGRLAPNLTRLWPELQALGEPPDIDPETDRYRLFEAVTALLESATRQRRALLVLDDLHWAARPTLLMLRHLIRCERPLGTFALGTCRPSALLPDHQLAQLLAEPHRDASVANVSLGGLAEHAIAALLEAVAGHKLDERARGSVRVLQAETGGNPFFVRELLAHLVETGAVYRSGERWTTQLAAGQLAIPEGLRHVIGQRVTRLSEPARRALGVAAVAGPSFSLALLERVLAEADLLDGLDQAVHAHLLIESAPGEYTFAHTLVRQTIYEQHSATRRMRFHRQLGEALETLGDVEANLEALAHHFAQAAADGQAAKAAAYAESAGHRAATRLAYEDAADHFERGLRALELADRPDETRRGELLLALADARWSSGEIDRAREACRLAASLAHDRGDSDQMARAALSFAGPVRLEVASAVTEHLVGLLEHALDAIGDVETGLRARVMARLAAGLTVFSAERRQPALARDAIAMARRLGDKRALADVLASSYVAVWGPDNFEERQSTATELADIAEQVGDDTLAAVARSMIANNLFEVGDIDAAERELATLERQAETLRQHFPRALAAIGRARHAHLAGRLDEFEALAHEFRARSRETHDEQASHIFAAQMLYLRSEQGRLKASDRPLPWRSGLAFAHAQLDRRAAARRELQALARNDFSDLPRDVLWLPSLATLSSVVAYLNDAPRAELLYDMLLPYAQLCVGAWMPFCLGSASRPLGLLATTMGRLDTAARQFEDALAMNSRIRSPLCVAHTQHDYARTLLRRDKRGDHGHALELLRQALATAKELGLTALADRALRLMREVQATPST